MHLEIPYKVRAMDFDSKGDALTWEFENQDSRRNLTTGQRIEAAHKVEDVIKAEAKERQAAYYGNQYESGHRENFPEVQTGRATDKLGAMAGVSRKTYEKGAKKRFQNRPSAEFCGRLIRVYRIL